MIKKLQLKFIALTMGALILVFVIVLATLNIFMRFSSAQTTESFLQKIVDEDGFIDMWNKDKPKDNHPPKDNEPDKGPGKQKIQFFYVKLDGEKNPLEIRTKMAFDFTESEALEYTVVAIKNSRKKGRIDNYQYLVADKSYGKIVVFAERSIELQMLSRLTHISLFVAGISCLLLLGVSVILSKWAVLPVKNAFEKQRQFISDASHELKTPLTIMKANMDVLENEIGENQRISNTKIQSNRMNLLIHDLLTLAKTDEGNERMVMAEFNVSTMVWNTILEFESRAFEEHKEFEYDIQKELFYRGNEVGLKQVVSIFIDNAIRYSTDNGTIKINLKKSKEKLIFSVFNTGGGISKTEQDRLFERFYRSDQSRARETGGYGLGLAIAKAIVDTHKGKITIESEQGKWVRFSLILPYK